MSIMVSVLDYIAACPLLDENLPLYLDYVSNEDCYCIAQEPNVPYIKDILGNKTYTVTFQFALRATISDDNERLRNVKFFEEFCRWIDEQNEARRFPALGSGESGVSIAVKDTGSLDEVSEDRVTGVYTAALQFIYKERKV